MHGHLHTRAHRRLTGKSESRRFTENAIFFFSFRISFSQKKRKEKAHSPPPRLEGCVKDGQILPEFLRRLLNIPQMDYDNAPSLHPGAVLQRPSECVCNRLVPFHLRLWRLREDFTPRVFSLFTNFHVRRRVAKEKEQYEILTFSRRLFCILDSKEGRSYSCIIMQLI